MKKQAARCALGHSRSGPQSPSLYSGKGTLPRAALVCVSVAVLLGGFVWLRLPHRSPASKEVRAEAQGRNPTAGTEEHC